MTRLRARNELLALHPPYLSFSLEETRAFFAQELPFPLSIQVLRQIHEKLEGWPTGIRLLASMLYRVKNEQELTQTLETFSGGHWSIQDYFLNEVLHTLPEELADLLRGLLPQIREKTLLAYARRILSAFDRETGTSDSRTQPATALLLEPLSAQEQKVLRLLAAGNSNAEIARELVVSVNTIRTQVQSIYRKLNVNNRAEASSVAQRLDVVRPIP